MSFLRCLLFISLAVFASAQNYTAEYPTNSTHYYGDPIKFESSNFFDALDQNCDGIAKHLESCPENGLSSSKERFEIASTYAFCLATQYGNSFACSAPLSKQSFIPVDGFTPMSFTRSEIDVWTNATFPGFAAINETCKLPKLVPIIEKACEFDLQAVSNSTCCADKPGQGCGQLSFNLLACSIQSVRTYVGCTAKGESNVTQCVVNTAKRINFVPIGFQIDSNGNECPTATETIYHLTRVTIVEFVIFFLLENPAYWVRLWRRFVQGKDVKVRTRTFRVSNLGFWTTIAKDVCENVVLVTLVLGKQGFQVNMLKNLVLFSVRPRGAFFHALLGWIDGGWGSDALIDMVAQILLSVFGGWVALIGAITADHTSDPSRPVWWKTYLAGGAIASIVTDMIIIYLLLAGLSVALICLKQLKPAVFIIGLPCVLAFMMLIVGPCKELYIMGKNIYNMCRKRPRYQNPDSLWNLKTDLGLRRWYIASMVVSFILFVGCWMFWNGFLKLSGELYCPQDLSNVDITMIAFFTACVLLRKLISFLQGEQAENKAVLEEFIGGE